MFNLYQLIESAHGGQGIDSLAQQFGLSRDQADSAVKALVPSLSTAFMTKVRQPGGVGDIAGAMTDDHHQQAYADPGAARDPATQQKGGSVAGNIFGNSAIVHEVAQKASQYTGIPPATLERMLPVIISMVVGGIASQMRGQGMGGLLGQLANSGLGGMLGNLLGGGQQGSQGKTSEQTGGQTNQGGGLGGILGGLVGSLLGGGGDTQADREHASASGQGASPEIQAGIDALSKMFHPGVQAEPAAQPDDLGGQISSILSDRKS